MKLYKIPVYMRSTSVGSGSEYFRPRTACVQVDELGVIVHYEKKEDLNPDVLRRHLTCRSSSTVWIRAVNPGHALIMFEEEYPQSKIGGEKAPESKAMWIDREKKIIEFPDCPDLLNDEYGEWVCGPSEYKSGCILEGYDSYPGCPVYDFEDRLYEEKRKARKFGGTRYAIAIGKTHKDLDGFWVDKVNGFEFLREETEEPLLGNPDQCSFLTSLAQS
jgi:hypothetical protein